MSVLLIINYDVSDAERFAEYNPGSLKGIFATISKHGGAITHAGRPESMVGDATQASVCISFDDADAAKAWLADEEYAPFKAIRYESTTNISEYIVPGLG